MDSLFSQIPVELTGLAGDRVEHVEQCDLDPERAASSKMRPESLIISSRLTCQGLLDFVMNHLLMNPGCDQQQQQHQRRRQQRGKKQQAAQNAAGEQLARAQVAQTKLQARPLRISCVAHGCT